MGCMHAWFIREHECYGGEGWNVTVSLVVKVEIAREGQWGGDD